MMMWHARRALVVLAVLLASGTGTAFADDPEGRLSIWFYGGWTNAQLQTANDLINDGNARFEELGFSTMDPFHNLFNLGAELDLMVAERFTLYAAYASLFGGQSESFNRVVRTDISGTEVRAGLMYRIPWLNKWRDALDDLDLFVGLGAIYLTEVEFTATDEDLSVGREFIENRIFSGTGMGGELRLNLEYYLSPKFTLMGGVGYRVVKANDLEHSVTVENTTVFNPTGDDDRDGILNQNDPDYNGASGGDANSQRMYGDFETNTETGEQEWQKPRDRYLESLYVYDPNSYTWFDATTQRYMSAPDEFQVYDPNAQFDLDMSGVQLTIGLSYWIF